MKNLSMQIMHAILFMALCIIAVVWAQEESDPLAWYFHVENGTYVDINMPDDVGVQEIATMEIIFKTANCTLQGIVSQRYFVEGHEEVSGALRGTSSGPVGPIFHGRGAMITDKGSIVVFSRDKLGRWTGLNAGACVPDKWVHIGLVQTGAHLEAYNNGHIVATTDMYGVTAGEFIPSYTMGKLSEGYGSDKFYFSGEIASLRVWKVARTAAAMQLDEVGVAEDSAGLAFQLKYTVIDGIPTANLINDPSETKKSTLEVIGNNAKLVKVAAMALEASVDAAEPTTGPAPPAFKREAAYTDIRHAVDPMVEDLREIAVPAGMITIETVVAPPPPPPGPVLDEPDAEPTEAPVVEEEVKSCPNDCSGIGTCNLDTGECICSNKGLQIAPDCHEIYQGHALEFDSSKKGFLQLPPMGYFEEISIGMWLKLELAPEDEGKAVSIYEADDKSQSGALTITVQGGQFSLAVTGNSPNALTLGGEPMPSHTWKFVVITYHIGTAGAVIYLDGQLSSTVAFTTAAPLLLASATVGGHPGSDAFLNGQLDELQFWRIALSSADVKALVASRRTGSEKGLVALYDMNEAGGDLAHDRIAASRELSKIVVWDGLVTFGSNSWKWSDAFFLPCESSCGKHGECFNGQCRCYAGFGGALCNDFTGLCATACSGRGECVEGMCVCQAGYSGSMCEWAPTCPNLCSGRGKCVKEACVCEKIFDGNDCSQRKCPNMCSGNGKCTKQGCACKTGWGGSDCSQDAMFPMRCVTLIGSGDEAHSTQCSRSPPPSEIQIFEVADDASTLV